jgi:hypothetical protein
MQILYSICNKITIDIVHKIMKLCILLSGLQRNFEPFIENQLNIVINAHDLDVFIFTSNQNALRFYDSNGVIDYVKRENFANDEKFFKSKYKNLKGIHIDNDDCKFNEFIRQNHVTKHRNHTLNMINSYFKINECIKLMECYENENNFKYDIVIRCRLDFFAYNDFLNPHTICRTVIYLPMSKYNDHKDDSGFIMHRSCVEYFKQFINCVIQFNDQNEFIIIEDQLFDYLKKQYQLCFTTQFSYRIGVAGNLSEIPFLNETHKLDSIEHKQWLHSDYHHVEVNNAVVIIPASNASNASKLFHVKPPTHKLKKIRFT